MVSFFHYSLFAPKEMEHFSRKGSLMPKSKLQKWHETQFRISCLSIRATDETRTRGLHLGKVALYQLSYYRMCAPICVTHHLYYPIP